MKKMPLILAAGAALMASAWTSSAVMAADEGTAKPITSGSVKPHLGNGPADEKSLPSSASAATTTAKTGASDQNKTVKAMNNSEKNKVEAEGK